MGFWPFGGGKRQRVVETDEPGRETLLRRNPSDSLVQEKYSEDVPSVGRTNSKTRRRDEGTRRLSKTRTSSSKALGATVSPYTQPASTRPPGDTRRTSQINDPVIEKTMYQQSPLSQSSLGPENFTVVRAPPTLHAKRSENDPGLLRRKSSKRKADDSAREKEIRALSSSPIPIPKRPATIYDSGPLQRDSRYYSGPLNRRLERPMSEISLPMAGSLPDIYDFPNSNSFKVGILAALSPRPIVRYDANSKITTGKQVVRPNLSIQQAIAEDDVSDKQRIDELADDLDAGGLRKLMERDRRHRERKKEAEKARLQRRLNRRAERQREEEARRARTEAFVRSSPTATPRTPVSGTERPTTPKVSPFKDIGSGSPENNPFTSPGPSTVAPTSPIRNPFDDENDMDVMKDSHESGDEGDITASSPTPIPVQSSERRVNLVDDGSREKPSQSTLSPPVSPVNRVLDRSSISQRSLLNREATPDVAESSSLSRRASDQSSQRLSSWTTFFRRGTRRNFVGPKQSRGTPSEFSNTSRESFARKQPTTVAPRTFRRSDSATPQRTLSKFREDLPELPISPPDSRIQSPETTAPVTESVLMADEDRENTQSLVGMQPIKGSPGLQIPEQMDGTTQRRSVDFDVSNTAGAGTILSQSLASVDSEGSWLSGKPSKRQSSQRSHTVRPSQSSLQNQMSDALDRDDEDKQDDDDDDVVDDEYYKRLSSLPQDLLPQEQQQQQQPSERRASSTIIDLKGESIAKHPTLVQQTGPAKSNEGLLKESVSAGESTSSSGDAGDDPESDTAEAYTKETSIMRARSVEYKKGHVRHISTGSGKLLDIVAPSSQPSQVNLIAAGAQKSSPAPQTGSEPSGPS